MLEGLRRHAARHGFVSTTSLHEHDRLLQRSILLHFVGLDGARRAAGVPGPAPISQGAKRGPKPGSPATPRPRSWTRARVIAELARLHRAGRSTRLDDLIRTGLGSLVQTAVRVLGGLAAARTAAGVPQPPRRVVAFTRRKVTDAMVLAELRARKRQGKSLSTSRVPQSLYRAARYRFGSWPNALAAIGVTAAEARARNLVYTRAEIIKRLRKAARNGSDLRSVSVKKTIDPKAIHREFGTLAKAITAAGLDAHLSRRVFGGAKWNRDRVIDELRARAARGEHAFNSNMHKLAQHYFGGAEQARAAAGVPSPQDLRASQRRRTRGTEPARPKRRRW